MARIDESREGAVIQVLDIAQAPELKSKPKKAQIAMISTLAAGFLLLLFVFIRQALRGAAQTPDTAEKLTTLRTAWAKALGRPTPSLPITAPSPVIASPSTSSGQAKARQSMPPDPMAQ